ncbi:MAG: hypothetical protein ABEK50_00295 [bacterium]
MSAIVSRDRGSSVSLKCPGGRIGVGRFLALRRILKKGENLTLLITRRQALAVHGSLESIPGYLLDQLKAGSISGPNVKSYPYLSNSRIQEFLITEMKDLAETAPNLSLSYSPCEKYRANLRLDDFSLHRVGRDQYRLDTNLYKSPRTLLEGLETDDLSRLMDALRTIFDMYEFGEGYSKPGYRGLRMDLLRNFNNLTSESKRTPSVSSVERKETKLHEGAFAEAGSPLLKEGSRWLLIPVEAGVMGKELLIGLSEFLRHYEFESFRLTPEQNLLLPVPDSAEGSSYGRFFEASLEDPGRSNFLPRVVTCPGSTFCFNVETNPVELAVRLIDRMDYDESLVRFNQSHPIGITGCGETKQLERLHPVGIYPSGSGTYRLSIGGDFHSSGQNGKELAGDYTDEGVLSLIERIGLSFQESETDDFSQWSRHVELEELNVK